MNNFDKNVSPFAKLCAPVSGSVRWTEGFWAEWFATCRDVMIPNMWRLLNDDDISHAYANFKIAAGLEDGEHQGPKWHDGDFYKWLEAACHVYNISRDEILDRQLDAIVKLIGKVQREDGYIHTPAIITARNENDENRFHERLHFETYNMGHLMTAACVHFAATGKTTLLEIAKKATDFLYNFYKTAAPELARNAICPSHYMGVVDMYRTTGEPRYLELAKNLVEIRNLVQGGDDNQDRVPFREQKTAVGHAVRANYLYAGVADIYAETGDLSLLETLEQLWHSVTSTKIYITGGCGALYDGASPDGSPLQEQITRVHQAYGREYQLPNLTAYNETCANIGNVLWNWRMLNITGEAKYADILELSLYNSVLSGISLDGKRFFYTNPLRSVKDMPFELRWSRTREAYISCFCCPPNVVRMIAQAHEYAYSTSDEGIWANLYGSSDAHIQLPGGGRVNLLQETNYPWDGRIRITVNDVDAVSFDLMLRIPGWAESVALLVNGEPVGIPLQPQSYARLSRTWSSGDVVDLQLDMPAQLIEANPLVEETRNHLAVKRGPIVYCLESLDLPEGVGVLDVTISPEIILDTAEDAALSKLLPGLTTLKAKVLLSDTSETWDGQLYRTLSHRKTRLVDVQFIPYFAWDNRGQSEMTVWIPTASL